jgi:hypothetical protein
MTGIVVNRYCTIATKLVTTDRLIETQDLISCIKIVAHFFTFL